MDTQDHADLNAPDAKGKGVKARRPKAGKPAADAGKRSLNLRVDDETYERLTIHALRRRTTISGLVMDLARDNLREFSIHRNGTRGEGQGQ